MRKIQLLKHVENDEKKKCIRSNIAENISSKEFH